MTELERVIEFVKSKSVMYDSIYFLCEWNGFRVYSPSFNYDDDYFIGMPQYILVDNQKNIRLAECDEVFEILESLPDEYED